MHGLQMNTVMLLYLMQGLQINTVMLPGLQINTVMSQYLVQPNNGAGFGVGFDATLEVDVVPPPWYCWDQELARELLQPSEDLRHQHRTILLVLGPELHRNQCVHIYLMHNKCNLITLCCKPWSRKEHSTKILILNKKLSWKKIPMSAASISLYKIKAYHGIYLKNRWKTEFMNQRVIIISEWKNFISHYQCVLQMILISKRYYCYMNDYHWFF